MKSTEIFENNSELALNNEQSKTLVETPLLKNESSVNYHQAYLMPEEIFQKYFVGQPLAQNIDFLEKLLLAHDTPQTDIEQIKTLVTFVLGAKTHQSWQDFQASLLFDNTMELFNSVSQQNTIATQHGCEYFYTMLDVPTDEQGELDLLDEDDEYDPIIDKHNLMVSHLNKAFSLNEAVRDFLASLLNTTKSKTEHDMMELIEHFILPEANSEQIAKISTAVGNSKNLLKVINEEQRVCHNLIQGIINKDKTQTFAGIHQYVNYYLHSEMRDGEDRALQVNDIITLFFSDYFSFQQNPNSIVAERLIDLLFTYYDRDIFHDFVTQFAIPLNIVLRVEDGEHNYYVSLVEYATYYGKRHILPDLIKMGFIPQPFQAKIMEQDEIFHYRYQPLQYLPSLVKNDIAKEQDVLSLIEYGLIQPEHMMTYQVEPAENNLELTTGEEKLSTVTNNVFFWLAYEQFNEAIIALYERSQRLNQKTYLAQKHSQTGWDLLSYYLYHVKQRSAYCFDMTVLDIFLQEDLKVSTQCIEVLKDLSLDSMVHSVAYLADAFPEKSPKPKLKKVKAVEQSEALVSWFDHQRLDAHYRKLEKEKDAFNKEYVRNMLSNNQHSKKPLVVHDESIFDKLLEEFPNFEEVINFYKSQFRLKKLSGKNRITPILLLGEPGIGKTYFAKKLAQYLNTGYTFLDMASMTANWILTGNNGTWKGAKQGKILEAMMNSNTVNPIVLMDELEKARNGEHDPTMSLYQLLEEINAKSFTDEFIDFSFDASGIIYIACANSLGNLSEPLQTRFKIMHVPKPTKEQTEKIIQNIYKEAVANTGIFVDRVSAEVVEQLQDKSLRSIKVQIDDAIGKVLLKVTPETLHSLRDDDEQKLELGIEHFSSPIEKRKIGF